jgi:hypothetical protein
LVVAALSPSIFILPRPSVALYNDPRRHQLVYPTPARISTGFIPPHSYKPLTCIVGISAMPRTASTSRIHDDVQKFISTTRSMPSKLHLSSPPSSSSIYVCRRMSTKKCQAPATKHKSSCRRSLSLYVFRQKHLVANQVQQLAFVVSTTASSEDGVRQSVIHSHHRHSA